jgi:Ca2+/H+ antiporter, TMEM165/GDT1 family
MGWNTAGLAASTLLASAVEFVEAFTIVLAMGLTRGWRSTIAGTASALVLLAGVAAISGYALINWFPKSALQFVVGSLLLVFGLQWLRKAILRSSGLKAMHDEDEAFREETEAARHAEAETRAGLDWFGFVVSFKGVFLEGLEVIFIVITFGLNAHSMPTAIAGASAGGAIVLVAGIALHKPLARVPENTIKFAVGLLLSTFGTFWAVEGLGVFKHGSASVDWPGGDAFILAVLACWCALAWLAVRLLSPYGKGRLVTPTPMITKEAA